jgi:DNA-binding response OmpR family regulator
MARILLIDDDESLRPVLRLVMVHFGHTVLEARDGKEGLRLFESFRPDLLITDIVMPEKEGMGVLMDLRKMRSTVKIIAMSGGGRQGSVDYLRIAKLLGAHRVLAKPFSNEALMVAVNGVLAECDASLPAEPPAPATQAATS